MASSLKNWYRENSDAIKRSLVVKAAIALGSVSLGYFAAKLTGAWPLVLSGAAATWIYLTSPVEVPWGVLWILVLITVASGAFVVKRLRARVSPRNYVEDTFQGVRAKWSWSLFRLKPKNVRVLCPACSTRLVYDEYFKMEHHGNVMIPGTRRVSVCETCDRKVASGDVAYLTQMAIRQIERNLDTGAWKHKVGT